MSATRATLAPTRRLPEQPSLEQLRKQAKDLLQSYRSAVPAAVAEVNQFERNPDSAAFALSDAQRVIARAYGLQVGRSSKHLSMAITSRDSWMP